MKKHKRRNLFKRLLAGLMSVLMMITLLPDMAFVSHAAERVEIHVYDASKQNIDGADVVITWGKKNSSSDDKTSPGKTGGSFGEGKFAADVPNGYQIAGSTVSITKTGYKTITGEPITTYYNPIEMQEQRYAFPKDEYTLIVGELLTAQANPTPNHYGSSDESIATVKAATGEVKALKRGEATIYAYDDDGKEKGSYKLTVNGKQQDALSWVMSQETIKVNDVVGFSFNGGSGNGTIMRFSNPNEIASFDPEKDKVTFHERGEVTLTAIKDADDEYESTTADIKLRVWGDPQGKLIFDGEEIEAIEFGDNTKQLSAKKASSSGTYTDKPIVYSSSDESVLIVNASNGKLTTKGVGIAEITATMPGNDTLEDTAVSCFIQVKPGKQPMKFEIKQSDVPVLACGSDFTNKVTGAVGSVTYTVAEGDEDKVSVNNSGKVTGKLPGTATIIATAQASGNYKKTAIQYTITVVKGKKTVYFDQSGTVKKTIDPDDSSNNIFKNTIHGGPDGVKPVYSYKVLEGSDCVKDGKIDKNGQLEFVCAGKIEVTASYPESTSYEECHDSYVLEVEPAQRSIHLVYNEQTVYLGSDNVFAFMGLKDEGEGGGDITYSVLPGDDPQGLFAGINEDGTFSLNFKIPQGDAVDRELVGKVVVTVTKASDGIYEEATDQYTLYVKCHVGDEDVNYRIHGTKNESTGWYVSPSVYISPIDSNDQMLTLQFMEIMEKTVTFESEDGENEGELRTEFLLQDDVTSEYYYCNVMFFKDSKSPYSLQIDVNSQEFNWFQIVFWGFPEELTTFDFTAEDNVGVARTQFYVDYGNSVISSVNDIEALVNNQWKDGDTAYVANIKKNPVVVYVKVTDAAGHVSYASTNQIVFTLQEPTVVFDLDNQNYYTSDFTVPVKIYDVDAGIKQVYYWIEDDVKGIGSEEEKALLYEFNKLVTVENLEHKLENKVIHVNTETYNSDKIVLHVLVVDNHDSKFYFENTYKVLATEPQMSVTLSTENYQEKNGNWYFYDGERTATINITCRSTAFDPDKVEIVINESKGTDVDENKEHTYVISDWSITSPATSPKDLDNVVHTATITFSGSAEYSFTVRFEDEGHHVVGPYKSESFVIDLKAPEATIDVTSSNVAPGEIWRSWTEKNRQDPRTYDLWTKDNVEVSLKTTDNVSPIKRIQYYCAYEDDLLPEESLETVAWEDAQYGAMDQIEERYAYGTDIVINSGRFAVYWRITDYANHVTYACTNGIIIDEKNPEINNLTKEKPNGNGYYNQDLTFIVSASDPDTFSGIHTLDYWLVCDGKKVEEKNLFTHSQTKGNTLEILNSIKNTTEYEIPISMKTYNSDDVRLYVKATDNAGHVSYLSLDGTTTEESYIPLKFSATPPQINITILNDNKDKKAPFSVHEDTNQKKRAYFGETRSVMINVTGRASVFDEEAFFNGMIVNAWDAAGQKIAVDVKNMIHLVEQTDAYDENGKIIPDKHVRRYQIDFDVDANYDFSLYYIDLAGNACLWTKNMEIDGVDLTKCQSAEVTFGNSNRSLEDTDQYFTVDVNVPNGTVSISGYTWTTLLNILTFGLWKAEDVTVEATKTDKTSPAIIEYYVTDSMTSLTGARLAELYVEDKENWKLYEDENKPVMKPDKRLAIYLRISDYAGNFKFINADGIILDTKPLDTENIQITLSNPVTRLKPEKATDDAEEIGVYNDDVTATIKISELDFNLSNEELKAEMQKTNYSGIKLVEYWIVMNEGEEYSKKTEHFPLFEYQYVKDEEENSNGGTLTIVNETNGILNRDPDFKIGDKTPTYEELIHSFETKITIKAEDFNCSDVTLHVGVLDNAENYSENTVKMDIDVTNPSISISYNNNNANESHLMADGRGYFPADRTATIVVTERKHHFDGASAVESMKITAKNAKGKSVPVNLKNENGVIWIVEADVAPHEEESGDEEKASEISLAEFGALWKYAAGAVDETTGAPNPDGDTHELKIHYAADANYEFQFVYVDKAGNVNKDKDGTDRKMNFVKGTVAPLLFTVDKVKPYGTVSAWDEKKLSEEVFAAYRKAKNNDKSTADKLTDKEVAAAKEDFEKALGEIEAIHTWKDLLKVLTFGIWNNKGIAVTATWDDETSETEHSVYYLAPDNEALTWDDLEKIADENWSDYDAFDLEPNQQRTVYLRITDYAGNRTYVSTNALILDSVAPGIDVLQPATRVSAEASSDIYNGDVVISVSVSDPVKDEAFSGIKSITYMVSSMGVQTQTGILYENKYDTASGIDNDSATEALDKAKKEAQNARDAGQEVKDPELEGENSILFTYDKLTKTRTFSGSFTVIAAQNNSNNVVATVEVEDNAGNRYSKAITLKIDVTKPKIGVSYDNNDGDVTFADGTTGAFFKDARTATIVVTERNFDPSRFVLNVTNTDGVIPTLSGWTTNAAGGNGDGTTHTATITYAADGDYTFDCSLIDQAGNHNEAVEFGNSLAPQKFTVDRTAPVITITYDNNNARNGNYYKMMRSATVTIEEHNFETSRIRVAMTATNDGTPVALPQVSNWANYGDRHVAVINFSSDALYSLDVDYSDKAGNASADMEPHRFYVDQTMPVLKIEGIVDESANNASGNIGFVMTATDVNFDEFKPTVRATVREGEGFAVKELKVGTTADVKNGKTYTVKNLEADGIYRVECVLVDKAGNEYVEVLLANKNGKEYAESRKAGDALVTFSVNRDGSTYELGEKTKALVEKYYVRNVTDDVVLIEVNADPLTDKKVTVNGRTLTPGTDYVVTESGGKGKWYRYEYSVKSSVFAGEGEYVVVCSSKDKANNDAFNDVKGVNAKFVVDRTAPVVTVTGLSDTGRYQTESQTVTIVPTDDGGALKSVTVSLVGKDGSVISDLLKLEGEALEKMLEQGNGMLNFQVPEGLYQNVKIKAEDMAGTDENDPYKFDQTIVNVSVTPNGFLIFWANRPLRYGVIGGLAAFVALFIFLLVWKKKKGQRR